MLFWREYQEPAQRKHRGPPIGRLQRRTREVAPAAAASRAGPRSQKLLVNINSEKYFKNRNVYALFIAYYTVAFVFSSYLKTCSHITVDVHEHAKKVRVFEK